MKIPEIYNPVMPYLLVKDAYRFLAFAKDVFGATQQHLEPRSEGVIKHAEIRIGEAVIMFADATDDFPVFPASIFLFVEDADKVYDKSMAAGLTQLMPLEDRPYGRGFGFADDFGNSWWVNTPIS